MKRSVFRTNALLFLGTASVLCIAAFLRGNYLLGPWYASLYVVVTLGLLWLLFRSFTHTSRPSLARLSLVLVSCLLAGFAMAFPAAINPDMQVFIDHEASARTARAELAKVFAADLAFGDLSANSVVLRAVTITVQGSLAKRADFDRLRSRVVEECPALTRCFLRWEITIHDPAQRIDAWDPE